MVVCKNFPDCKGMFLDYKVLSHTIIYGEARNYELEKGLGIFPNLSMDKKVECLHCGDKYLYNEANVVFNPNDGQVWIHCKNYPKCNGLLHDLMPTE